MKKLSLCSHFKVILTLYTEPQTKNDGGFHMSILEVKDLSKIYGKGDTAVKALHDVSFSVNKGDFVCIIWLA